MPDSAQEKSEAPSARRLQEARQRGQIGKSSDLAGAVILFGAMVVLNMTGGTVLQKFVEITKHCLGAGAEAVDPGGMTSLFAATMKEMASIVLPLLLVITVLALAAMFMQVGVLFTFDPLKPSLNKINPLSGLKRIFSSRSVIQLLMGVGKAVLLSAVAYWTVKGRMEMLAGISAVGHLTFLVVLSELVFTLGIRMAGVLLILALLDFAYQKYKTYSDLKMTKEEVREESKHMDGDPQIKRRRRQVQLQLAMQRMRIDVPQADVIVTNPTELAIAIKYDSKTMAAPRVVAKGADYMAMRIRQIAIEHSVPIIERKPLARAIYREVEVGHEVPAHLYKAVAEILAYVYQMADKHGYPASPVGAGMN